MLAKANASTLYLTQKLYQHLRSIGSDPDARNDLENWINSTLVVPGLGITNAHASELKKLASDPAHAIFTFSKMISNRARVGWSTHGHSAVDVNVYSSGGRYADTIRGNVENTDIGKFLSNFLDVDTEAVTQELKAKMNWKEPSLAGMPIEDALVQMGLEMEGAPEYWLE